MRSRAVGLRTTRTSDSGRRWAGIGTPGRAGPGVVADLGPVVEAEAVVAGLRDNAGVTPPSDPRQPSAPADRRARTEKHGDDLPRFRRGRGVPTLDVGGAIGQLLHKAGRAARGAAQLALRQTSRTRYAWPEPTPEVKQREREAAELFLSSLVRDDPVMVRWAREQGRLKQLADPVLGEERKQELRAEGPRCTPEDSAEMLARYAKAGRRPPVGPPHNCADPMAEGC